MAYTVEFYLQRYSKRVASICQFESHLKKLDYDTIHREATRTAMLTAQDYNDEHGTNGFIRWFTRLTSDLCLYFLNNRDEYSGLVRNKKLTDMETPKEITKEDEPVDPIKNQLKVKVCKRCKQPKPLNQFDRANRSEDGLTKWCSGCREVPKKSEPVPQEEKTTLVLSLEDLEAMILIYSNKLKKHIEDSSKETNRITLQIEKWTAILNKRKST
jgi:hypothetical protein